MQKVSNILDTRIPTFCNSADQQTEGVPIVPRNKFSTATTENYHPEVSHLRIEVSHYYTDSWRIVSHISFLQIYLLCSGKNGTTGSHVTAECVSVWFWYKRKISSLFLKTIPNTNFTKTSTTRLFKLWLVWSLNDLFKIS